MQFKYLIDTYFNLDALRALPPTIIGHSPESWSVDEPEKTYLPQTKRFRTSLFTTPTQNNR
jgi:hypothetical protein